MTKHATDQHAHSLGLILTHDRSDHSPDVQGAYTHVDACGRCQSRLRDAGDAVIGAVRMAAVFEDTGSTLRAPPDVRPATLLGLRAAAPWWEEAEAEVAEGLAWRSPDLVWALRRPDLAGQIVLATWEVDDTATQSTWLHASRTALARVGHDGELTVPIGRTEHVGEAAKAGIWADAGHFRLSSVESLIQLSLDDPATEGSLAQALTNAAPDLREEAERFLRPRQPRAIYVRQWIEGGARKFVRFVGDTFRLGQPAPQLRAAGTTMGPSGQQPGVTASLTIQAVTLTVAEVPGSNQVAITLEVREGTTEPITVRLYCNRDALADPPREPLTPPKLAPALARTYVVSQSRPVRDTLPRAEAGMRARWELEVDVPEPPA